MPKYKDFYDVIIIGSSLGGLSAGLQLGMAGKKVLILEQHNLPGGLATSFVRGPYEFEATLHELQSVGTEKYPRKIRTFMDEAGVEVEWLQVPEAYRLILPNEDIDVVMPYGVENMIDVVEKEVPGTRDEMTRLMKLCVDVTNSINYFGEIGGADKLSKRQILKEHEAFVKTTGYSAKEVIDTFDLPEKAIHIISPYWIYVGVPLSRLSFTVWAYLMADYFEGGAVVCKNNSHALSVAMDKRVRELGGQIEYRTKVDKILVENNKVVGVKTASGDVINSNYVISGSYPNKVYTNMIEPLDAVPSEAIKLTNSRNIGVTAFVVYLALKGTPQELKLTDYSYFVGSTMDTDEIWENYKTIDPPKYITTIVLNNADKDCFPKGTTEMSITYLPKPDGWMDVKAEDYNDLKRKIAKSMIQMMGDSIGVNLFEHIEEIEIATPATIARYTGSWNGSVYGYEHQVWDSIVARMATEREERYINGLEFAGAHASIGNGYAPNITSGRKAAAEILNDMRKKEE